MNVGGRAVGGANSHTNIDQLARLASPWRAGRGIEAVTGRMASTRIGRSLDRFEDFPLLTGRGRYAGDLPVAAGTLHAAVLRSPHAHAEILAIDASRALAMPGVECGVTGEDARRWTRPFTAAVRSPIQHWCLATGRVRYQGEPVAVVVASDRYRAEDALEAVEVTYRPLPATVDPRAAAVHDVVSDRRFRYGEPEAAFAAAAHRIAITTRYPRNACTPVECFVVVAEYLRGGNAYEVTANFQGPLALHPVMARALGVPANRLRPQDAAGLGRQLWRQARGLSVYRADGDRRAEGRPAGEVGRGSARAPARSKLGDEPADDPRGGSHRARRNPGARVGPDRGLRRLSARRSPPRSTACTAT